jgi:cysteine desulfurase/selenocysteine lyase
MSAAREVGNVRRFDVEQIRKDFPVLGRDARGKPLAYLDNAATAQKPRVMIEAVHHYYAHYNANIHRGVHALSEEATQAYEEAREKLAEFIGAPEARELVFVRGTTEGINLVSQAFLRPRLQAGDEILITHLEHHSNIVPWQLLCEQTGAVLRVAPIDDRGEVEVEAFERLLGPRTRMVAVGHVSNALGTINPVRRLIELAKQQGAAVLLDGAQAVPHLAVNVADLGCDFYAFSGHKMYGPMGVGGLWARGEILEEMGPYQAGGEMILSVSFERTTYNRVPHKFEAGTPNIAGAIGLGATVDYLRSIDLAAAWAHEDSLLDYATERLREVPGTRIIGTAREKAGVLSFTLEGVHPHDVGTVLDQDGIAVRTGHHCAQPVMQHFGIAATTRASFAMYNTREEVDRLIAGLHRVNEIFA